MTLAFLVFLSHFVRLQDRSNLVDLSNSKGPNLLPDVNAEALDDTFFLENDLIGLRPFAEEVLETRELSPTSLVGLWANLLMLEEDEIRIAIRRIPKVRYVSYGFLDPELERDGFGIIVYSLSRIVEQGFFSNFTLESRRERSPLARLVGTKRFSFPIFVRTIEERLHVACQPIDGTAGCLARSRVRSKQPFGPGFLTTQHIVSDLAKKLRLACCGNATILDRAPYGIDAMLVESPCNPTIGSQTIALQNVAPWTDVTFHGSTSGTVQTKVTDVTNTQGVFSNAHLPIRLFLGKAGQPGDSGSLVQTTTGDPIGLYMGEYNSAAGVTGGFAQHLFQVSEIMDLELFT